MGITTVQVGHGADEVCGIGIVFVHARCHGQYVGVEDYVRRRHTHPFGKQVVGTFTDAYTTFIGGGLSLLVKSHHYHGSPHAMGYGGSLQEYFFALFQ